MKVCMISCCYNNASVANYTLGLISSIREMNRVEVKLVSSHCECIKRFKPMTFETAEECTFVNLPYFPSSKRKIKKIEMNLVPKELLDFLRGFFYLKESRGYDVIHFQQSSSYAFSPIALIPIILFSTKRKVLTFHSPGFGQRLMFFLRLYNRVDKIIVHSESMRTHLLNKGVNSSKIIKIFHGVDIPPLYGLERSEITFIGAPEKRKGFLTILDALKILKSKNIDVKLSIYGFYSNSEKNQMQLQASMRKVDDCLIWGGQLSENEINIKLQQSLFTLAVYNTATSGSSVVTRSMSNATPVLASDIGGLKEYLGNTGIFVPPKDPKRLADTIELLLNSNNLENFGKKSRERAVGFFSWNAIAQKNIEVYNSIK
jgi:glycosyltransferase involved in cell wall biosynthesis